MRAVLVGFVLGLCGAAAACGSSDSGLTTASEGGAAAGSAGTSASAGVGGVPGAAGTSGASGKSGQGGDANGGAGGDANGGEAGTNDGSAGAPDCAPSDRACDGLTPLSCQNGQLRPNGVDCAFACQDGACSGECASGATRCQDKVFETCGMNNLWQTGTSCAFVCDDMRGCTGACLPGATECASATELDVCNAQGAFEKSADCDLECAIVASQAECAECTSGDGLCPGGCTHPEDSDCAVDASPSCPNIYFGLGRYRTPQPADFANDSISALPTMKVGVPQSLGLSLYNHGHTASPAVTLELLWGDPSDGCRDNLHFINDGIGFDSIPAASLAPAMDGVATTNTGFVPGADALATNGGRICILARMYETVAPSGSGCVQQENNSVSPATDPLSAILEVQIQPAN
jgi:hypothetical protein